MRVEHTVRLLSDERRAEHNPDIIWEKSGAKQLDVASRWLMMGIRERDMAE